MSLSHDLRKLRARTALWIGIFWVAAALPANASEFLATNDFRRVEQVVSAYVETYGADHVLLAVDIDNTLLAMDHDLGSDQWFEWQDHLLANEPNSPHLVANDFDGLLEVQGLLFTLGRMHPPQPEQPEIVRRVQRIGVATLVLTSRGDKFRKATERELRCNGYDFARTGLPTGDIPGGTYAPYDLAAPADSGLTPEEVCRFSLEEPIPVSYANGIMMTAGQHKGAMLLALLYHSPREVHAVVFADDHGRHVERVFAALTGRGIEVTAIHYTREDERVDKFKYGDKRNVTRHWRLVADVLEAVVD